MVAPLGLGVVVEDKSTVSVKFGQITVFLFSSSFQVTSLSAGHLSSTRYTNQRLSLAATMYDTVIFCTCMFYKIECVLAVHDFAEHAPCVSMATGGPLSVGKELAQLYNLEGVKEVNVRKVDKDEVGIDLLEIKFKVQNNLRVHVHAPALQYTV